MCLLDSEFWLQLFYEYFDEIYKINCLNAYEPFSYMSVVPGLLPGLLDIVLSRNQTYIYIILVF